MSRAQQRSFTEARLVKGGAGKLMFTIPAAKYQAR
jgi:hypothetical protein